MLNAQTIKQNLSNNNIILLLSELGSEWYEIKSDHIEFESICHHSKSHKLWYNINEHYFYCHRCAVSDDVFSLVQKVKNCSFIEALNLVIDVCHLDIEKYNEPKLDIDDWQSTLLPLIQNKTPQTLQIYDKNVMRLFDDLYWSKWVDEGISVESMQKFNIKWYARNQSVAIPCYDLDGNLIGCRQRFTQAADCEKGKYRPLNTLNEEYKFPTGLTLWGAYQNQDAIRKSKSVILLESEKSILKLDGWGINNCASLYGANFTDEQKDILLTLGVERVTIALDRQFKTISNDDDGFIWWKNHIKKIALKLQPYMYVDYIYDYNGLTNVLDAPVDKGKEIWEKLYESKRKWN